MYVKLVVRIKTTGLFKDPYEVPVTYLQKVTKRQRCMGRTDGQNNISNNIRVMMRWQQVYCRVT